MMSLIITMTSLITLRIINVNYPEQVDDDPGEVDVADDHDVEMAEQF